MSYLEAIRVMFGSASFLFSGAMLVGLGLHAGLSIGSRWFGAINLRMVNLDGLVVTVHVRPDPSKEGE